MTQTEPFKNEMVKIGQYAQCTNIDSNKYLNESTVNLIGVR